MSIVKSDDILGYWAEGKIYCSEECFHNDGNDELTEENIVFERNRDEEAFYFCDYTGCPEGGKAF